MDKGEMVRAENWYLLIEKQHQPHENKYLRG